MGNQELGAKNPQRRHFAEGDYVTRYGPGSEYAIEIDSRFEKTGWKPRRTPVDFSSAVFPGSAVQFEQQLYEVVQVMHQPQRVHYYLREWDTRFPVRVQYHYTAEECAKLEAQRKQQKLQTKTTLLIHLLTPIVGLLPASDQKRIGNRYGVSSSSLTALSAVSVFLPASLASLSLILKSVGSDPLGPAVLHDFYKFGPYFFCESIVRIFNAAYLEEPMGSLPVYFVIEMYRAIRRNFDPDFQQRRFEKMETGHKQLVKAVDEVHEMEGKDFDLEIISILPKPHWSPLTGIRYKGTWYGYLDSEKVGKAESLKYRFRLKRAPEGMVFRTFLEYTPEEVQELYRQQKRRDAGTWITTFSPFWGLLDTPDQKRLQEIYGFEAMRFTWWTILALGLLGFFNFLASVLNLAAHMGTPGDVLWLIASAYLLLETYLRWNKFKQGEPSGSVLGILFQPFARRLLET